MKCEWIRNVAFKQDYAIRSKFAGEHPETLIAIELKLGRKQP
jgi:hypothetical protein